MLDFEFVVSVDEGLDFLNQGLFFVLRRFVSERDAGKSLGNDERLEIDFLGDDLGH